MSLSEKFYKGYGHSPVHLLNKCETCNKNRRESNAVTKFREALSFSAFLMIFFAFAKSDIIATAIVILKPCGFSGILFALKIAKRIPQKPYFFLLLGFANFLGLGFAHLSDLCCLGFTFLSVFGACFAFCLGLGAVAALGLSL